MASSGLGHVSRGIEAWAADLGRALHGRGLDVVLFKGGGRAEVGYERVVPCWQRGEPRTARLVRALPRWVGWRLGLGGPYGVEQTTFALRLLPLLRREGIDLLHVQDPNLALLVQRAGKLGLVRTRVVLGHGTEEPLGFIRKINYLQHLAPWHLEEAKKAGVWKPTWTVIPNFIDTGQFRPGESRLREELGIPPHGWVVLTVAAIKREHKRIDYLIEEFGRLLRQRPDLPAWLVVAGGREADTDELVRLGKDKLGERARFLVRFPRERMPDLYRTADVFALCSLMEMMPIALLEAAASGLPCVVHRHPVMTWMTGGGGRAIDMAAEGGLSAALAELLASGEACHEAGAAAREHCVNNFGREQVVDQIVDYYRQVLADRRAANGSAGVAT